MRDEIDARIWVDNHEQLSRDLDGLVRRAGAALRRLSEPTGGTARLLALASALTLTLLTFDTTLV